ncbi:MAG TPA: RluA family pseudouridine synthase [Desulfobulbaceae bacterium]|nr:RluA family pseudouridine synthase [Desulfobulbaceae bacterium]
MGADELRIRLLYVDADLIVVEKPAGLLSVPGRGPDKQGCVARQVRDFFPDTIKQPAVHRLDMDTSGLMVLARTKQAHAHLSDQFARQRVRKRYAAILEGVIAEDEGQIELSFRLDPENRPYQVYDPVQGKSGVTRWLKLAVHKGRTRVEFIPLTGRTHQLRLHAAHERGLGCPIVGDRLYGIRKPGERMLLHAQYLQFTLPGTEKMVVFRSIVPF